MPRAWCRRGCPERATPALYCGGAQRDSVIAVDDEARLSRSVIADGCHGAGDRREPAAGTRRSRPAYGHREGLRGRTVPSLRRRRCICERTLSHRALTNKLTLARARPRRSTMAHGRGGNRLPAPPFAWHDHRLAVRRLDGGNRPDRYWCFLSRVDGRALRVQGGLWHARGPPVCALAPRSSSSRWESALSLALWRRLGRLRRTGPCTSALLRPEHHFWLRDVRLRAGAIDGPAYWVESRCLS